MKNRRFHFSIFPFFENFLKMTRHAVMRHGVMLTNNLSKQHIKQLSSLAYSNKRKSPFVLSSKSAVRLRQASS